MSDGRRDRRSHEHRRRGSPPRRASTASGAAGRAALGIWRFVGERVGQARETEHRPVDRLQQHERADDARPRSAAGPSATPARTARRSPAPAPASLPVEGVDRPRDRARRTTSRRTARRRPRRAEITSLRRSRRRTLTSPARPEAASTPVVAAVAMPSANSRSSQVGVGAQLDRVDQLARLPLAWPARSRRSRATGRG